MKTRSSHSIFASLTVVWMLVASSNGFVPSNLPSKKIFAVNAEATSDTSREASMLIEKLRQLADRTNRGFQASSADRRQARDIAFSLENLNPTEEPAAAYYESSSSSTVSPEAGPTVSGKWNLIYTDAPDITGLDTSRNPLSTASLGRIGQDCNPPYVKNVIEWKRPSWAGSLPFSGTEDSRVLQKVVTSASASPEKPDTVDLKIAGLEVENPNQGDQLSTENDIASRIEKDGLVAGLLASNPIDLKGPLNPPFGQFRILYLDEDLRITLTSQNYIAVNSRCKEGEEWF